MKCQFCGANIDIKSEKCPFCGMEKSQFEKHRKDMKKFSDAYSNVEKNVLEKNRRTTEKSVRITIVVVLCLLIAITIALHAFSSKVEKAIEKGKIKRELNSYISMLDEYEENADYLYFYQFYIYKELYLIHDNDRLEEYNLLKDMASDYYYSMQYLCKILDGNYKENSDNMNSYIESFVDAYDEFEKRYDKYVNADRDSYMYKENCYSEKHLASYEEMRLNLKDMVMTYFDFSEEEYEEYTGLSKANKILMIEEGISHE